MGAKQAVMRAVREMIRSTPMQLTKAVAAMRSAASRGERHKAAARCRRGIGRAICWAPPDGKGEKIMYAAIRQGTAKAGTAEELARRIKEGAIPIISDVPGFQAYYVIYAPDDTVTAISVFDDYADAQESNRRGLASIKQNLAPLLAGPATAVAGPVIVHTLA